jgi:predicted small secreted protein
MQTYKKLLFIGLFTCVGFVLSACNTISGIGEDLQAAGGAITNKAEEVQEGED